VQEDERSAFLNIERDRARHDAVKKGAVHLVARNTIAWRLGLLPTRTPGEFAQSLSLLANASCPGNDTLESILCRSLGAATAQYRDD
jgi:hypothetical protein